jgi:hypothetical protein
MVSLFFLKEVIRKLLKKSKELIVSTTVLLELVIPSTVGVG